MLTKEQAEQILSDNEAVLNRFIQHLKDADVQCELIEAASGTFGNRAGETMMRGDITTVLRAARVGNVFRVVHAFEFIVRHAEKVGPSILPRNVVPSSDVIQAMIVMYGQARHVGEALDEEEPGEEG